jgi:N-acetylglucosaminyl-diphospho-decaprenol L-rhamnosyltransferase
VVSVTYRAAEVVAAWVESLEAAWEARTPADGDRLAVLAVDNASPDGTLEMLRSREPFITVIAQATNRGFAFGCNVGLRTAEHGEIVIVINPDVLVSESFFRDLARLDWPPTLAVRGPQVLGRDGDVEQSARTFPTLATGLFGRTSLSARFLPNSRLVRRQLLADPEAGAVDVDWISGACMIAPQERWSEVGMLDERYFMYWEDADWCQRAHRRGLRVRYEPSLIVRHRQGSSSDYRPIATVMAFHRSAWRYHREHAGRGPAHDILAAVGLVGRATVKILLALASLRRGDGGRSPTRSRRS